MRHQRKKDSTDYGAEAVDLPDSTPVSEGSWKISEGPEFDADRDLMTRKREPEEIDINDIRRTLIARRKALVTLGRTEAREALEETSPAGLGDMSSVPAHPADQGSEMATQEERLTLVERQEGEIAEIDDALNRIEVGNYGVCENCEEPIPRARLEAIPEARYCLACEKEMEKYSIEDDLEGPTPVRPSMKKSANPDWRVLKAPRTRKAGTQDRPNDQRNLYVKGQPPDERTFEESSSEYNEAYGRGGFPASYYGRDSRPDLHSDETQILKPDSSSHRVQNDAPGGSGSDSYNRRTDEEGFPEEGEKSKEKR